MEVDLEDFEIDPFRTVIHNRFYKISGKKYWVEISNNPHGLAFVIIRRANAQAFNKSYYAAVLPMKIASKLLAEDENEADLFVKRLTVSQGALKVRGFNA